MYVHIMCTHLHISLNHLTLIIFRTWVAWDRLNETVVHVKVRIILYMYHLYIALFRELQFIFKRVQ